MTFRNPNTFAGSPLDRVSHLRADARWLDEARRDPVARVAVLWQLKPFLRPAAAGDPRRDAVWLTWSALAELGLDDPPSVFLGLADGVPHFAVDISALPDPSHTGPLAEQGVFMDLRAALTALPSADAACLGQAKAMLDWHARHGFCARCGAPTTPADAGYRRVCPSCKAEHFPRTDPVVIMLATHGERALLGRSAHINAPFFSALAGFLEPGETIEEAVAREIKEETAVEVGAVRYATNQPWPFPSSLMIGCFAEAVTEEIRVDPKEIAEARWFTRAELALALDRPMDIARLLAGEVPVSDGTFRIPPRFAIAHHLIRGFIEDD